jgi:hypothetical protein
MQTGNPKVTIKLCDAQRIKIELEALQSQNAELITLVYKLELDNESLMHTLRTKAAMNGYQPMNPAQSPAPGDE